MKESLFEMWAKRNPMWETKYQKIGCQVCV